VQSSSSRARAKAELPDKSRQEDNITIAKLFETTPGMSTTRPGRWLFVAVLALLTLVGSLPTRPAMASAIFNAASTVAVGELSACSSRQGKDLYNCVADVLDHLASSIGDPKRLETQQALQTAAAGLRAAGSKAQAVSAIARCQAAISGALKKVRAIGGGYVPSWGDSGLTSVSGVLSRAIQLIQTKG
jgi:hypothetical protein